MTFRGNRALVVLEKWLLRQTKGQQQTNDNNKDAIYSCYCLLCLSWRQILAFVCRQRSERRQRRFWCLAVVMDQFMLKTQLLFLDFGLGLPLSYVTLCYFSFFFIIISYFTLNRCSLIHVSILIVCIRLILNISCWLFLYLFQINIGFIWLNKIKWRLTKFT